MPAIGRPASDTRRARRRRAWAALLCSLGGPALAATWSVGPQHPDLSLPEALRQAADGDTIELRPGVYRGQVGVVTQRRLVLRGGGGPGARPVLVAAGRAAEGKAILVVRDGDIAIENLEFRGARVPDGNGAGIRLERGRLDVRRCAFVDNENGILTGNDAATELDIADSEFTQAPAHDRPLPHLLYVGRIARFTLTGSRFEQGHVGHLVKARARHSTIAYNLIVDGPAGRASYEIDLPNGGQALIIGNVIGQSARTENATVVSYGAEGQAWPDSALHLAHNTLLSADVPGARFLRVWRDRLPAGAAVTVINNLTIGTGVLTPEGPAHVAGNHAAPPDALVDVDHAAFALRPPARAQRRGVDPRLPGGPDLAPRAEFTPPVGTRPLPPPDDRAPTWLPGAFQR